MDLPVVVIDHHLMDGEIPPADALVNPNQPGDASGCGHLAAAGVTFVLLAALNREGRKRGAFKSIKPNPIFSILPIWPRLERSVTWCR
jgi:single-stranded-DNA-specific exonuclease